MEIDKKLLDEIRDYCQLNNLKIGLFVNKLLRKAFNNEKFGEKPMVNKNNTFSPIIKYNEEEHPMTAMEVLKNVSKEETASQIIKKEEKNEIIDRNAEIGQQILEKEDENTNKIKEVKRRKLN